MISKKSYLQISLLAITLVLLLATLLSGCSSLQSLLQNPKYLYENGAVLVDGADKPIELKNNPKAVDETYAQVLDFIRQDTTDLLPYIDRGNKDGLTPFVCSDFAARVHDNAEAAGIRAGYVSVDWAMLSMPLRPQTRGWYLLIAPVKVITARLKKETVR